MVTNAQPWPLPLDLAVEFPRSGVSHGSSAMRPLGRLFSGSRFYVQSEGQLRRKDQVLDAVHRRQSIARTRSLAVFGVEQRNHFGRESSGNSLSALLVHLTHVTGISAHGSPLGRRRTRH